MMINIVSVACGGAVGAIVRYLITLLPLKSAFPFSTLIANLVGAFIIGFLSSVLLSKNISLFLKTGLCGGLTAFSTFSMENIMLFQEGKIVIAFLYISVSLFCCFLGVCIGMWVGKYVEATGPLPS